MTLRGHWRSVVVAFIVVVVSVPAAVGDNLAVVISI